MPLDGPPGGAESSARPILELREVTKAFSGVVVVSGANLLVAAGETVCVVGENGAGKSTLMKIIAGVHPAGSYDGELVFDGETRRFRQVRDAERAGIVLVPQELNVAPALSIAENMFKGMLPGRWGLVDEERLHARARERLAFFEITADPRRPLGTLSPSEQRLVTIASALSKQARLIILDEPTAALTDEEGAKLFAHLSRLRAEGLAALYISHRLDEVERVGDRIVVMRNGRVVDRLSRDSVSRAQLVRSMIGREPHVAADRQTGQAGEIVLDVAGLTLRDAPHLAPRVRDVGFTLRRGEVLGLFGLVGAGRTEVARAIFGDWPGVVEGAVRVADHASRATSPREAIRQGLGMLTEDRKRTGVIEGQSLVANMSAASLEAVSGRLLIDETRERARADRYMRSLDVRPQRPSLDIAALSGGNQQKVLLARWLATNPKVLILDEPTLGVDVGARFELYRLIRSLVEEGLGVLLISSDLTEVLDECDRILVMYKGRITASFAAGASRHDVMIAATGEGVRTAGGAP